MGSFVSVDAFTSIDVPEGATGATVLTGIGVTYANKLCTGSAGVLRGALTLVSVSGVRTRGAVETRVRLAVSLPCRAIRTGIVEGARTCAKLTHTSIFA